MIKTIDLFKYDKNQQYDVIAGVDEAGRGPLAGPLVCACCIMPFDEIIDGIKDSKKVSELTREKLYDIIIKKAIDYRIEVISKDVIDKYNILNATKIGMTKSILGLSVKPSVVFIDAVTGLDIPYKSESIIKGDAISYSIASASILAKVTRDRIMREYDSLYPEFCFAKNKGYGTKHHIETLKIYGKTVIHRESFIKNFNIVLNYNEK